MNRGTENNNKNNLVDWFNSNKSNLHLYVLNFIIEFFYISAIILTIVYGSNLFLKKIFKKQTINEDSNQILNGCKDITEKIPKLLEYSEYLFLLLIPVIILIGFYNYYKIDLKYILLHNSSNIGKDSFNNSKDIKLSKTLFFSSIISFSVIKIIEVIFYPKKFICNNEDSIISDYSNVKELITYGVFLIIIISYQVLTQKTQKKSK